MKKIGSEELLDNLIALTSELIQTAENELSSLSQEQLFWNPNDKSWSIGQCLAHLNAFSRYYVPVFRERVKNTRFRTPAEIFMSSSLGSATYRNVKLGKLKNVKRKLKSPRDYNPLINNNLKTENALADFVKYMNELKVVLEKAKKVNIRRTKSNLSVTPIIKLRLGDAFMYIVYHAERHIEQCKRIKSTAGFPTQ